MKDILRTLHQGCTARPNEPLRVIGIDLGTTNSTVCEIVWHPGEDKPTPSRCLNIDQDTTQGRYTHVLVPSVVALYDGATWVGEGAKRLRAAQGAGLHEYKTWFAETKNDMGVRRTYHGAPAGLKSARGVATKILEFLYEAASSESDMPIARSVITVPASFQMAQRSDTEAAAQRAGITLANGELLDEPIAAFLAYLAECTEDNDDLLPRSGSDKTLVVLDFGGGTCDVAVLRLGRRPEQTLTVTPVSVSRYHRLGGGDIDRAIIHDVLLPQLLAQNGLDEHALGFEEKRHHIQPALLGVAEALKIKLSMEIARLKKFGRWDATDKAALVQTQPLPYPVELKDRTLILQSPKLSALEFENLLRPFFDRDLLMPREDEYRVSCSIFAPLEDALSRGHVNRDEVDICLLAGGSSLIPQVAEEIGDYFKGARLLTFPNREDTQTAIAKGAALHALSLALTGKAMFQFVCHDDIYFHTRRKPVSLVERGAALPYPADGEIELRDTFIAPKAIKAGTEGEIRIEFLAGEERRPMLSKTWVIRGPLKQGAPLGLRYSFSANQVLKFCIYTQDPGSSYEGSVENPLSHVVNPNADRSMIQDKEEALRGGKVPQEELPGMFAELAELYRRLRQYEKALSFYSRAIRLQVSPSAALMNRMAFCARDLGDRERAERIFLEADRVAPWSGTLFNWALAREQWGSLQDALDVVERAIRLEDDPPYSVLRARLLQKSGDAARGIQLAAATLEKFAPLALQDEYQRCWFRVAARMIGDDDRLHAVDAVAPKPSRAVREFTAELPDLERMRGEDNQ